MKTLEVSACPEPPTFHPAPSPEEIGRFANFDTLWGRLGISPQLRVFHEGGFDLWEEDFPCTDGCTAKSVSSERLLDRYARDEIVRVCTGWEHICRILLLHQPEQRWGLVDYVDSPFLKYGPPDVEVVPTGDRRWLLISSRGGGGTGVSLSMNEWIEEHCGRLRRVLRQP